MPTFVYLPGVRLWINMDHVVWVSDSGDGKPMKVVKSGDETSGDVSRLTGPDRDVFLKALSKLTPKELT